MPRLHRLLAALLLAPAALLAAPGAGFRALRVADPVGGSRVRGILGVAGELRKDWEAAARAEKRLRGSLHAGYAVTRRKASQRQAAGGARRPLNWQAAPSALRPAP